MESRSGKENNSIEFNDLIKAIQAGDDHKVKDIVKTNPGILDEVTLTSLTFESYQATSASSLPSNFLSPLQVAVIYGNIEIIKYLLDEKPGLLEKIDEKLDEKTATPLYMAIFLDAFGDDRSEVIRVLLERGADIKKVKEEEFKSNIVHWNVFMDKITRLHPDLAEEIQRRLQPKRQLNVDKQKTDYIGNSKDMLEEEITNPDDLTDTELKDIFTKVVKAYISSVEKNEGYSTSRNITEQQARMHLLQAIDKLKDSEDFKPNEYIELEREAIYERLKGVANEWKLPEKTKRSKVQPTPEVNQVTSNVVQNTSTATTTTPTPAAPTPTTLPRGRVINKKPLPKRPQNAKVETSSTTKDDVEELNEYFEKNGLNATQKELVNYKKDVYINGKRVFEDDITADRILDTFGSGFYSADQSIIEFIKKHFNQFPGFRGELQKEIHDAAVKVSGCGINDEDVKVRYDFYENQDGTVSFIETLIVYSFRKQNKSEKDDLIKPPQQQPERGDILEATEEGRPIVIGRRESLIQKAGDKVIRTPFPSKIRCTDDAAGYLLLSGQNTKGLIDKRTTKEIHDEINNEINNGIYKNLKVLPDNAHRMILLLTEYQEKFFAPLTKELYLQFFNKLFTAKNDQEAKDVYAEIKKIKAQDHISDDDYLIKLEIASLTNIKLVERLETNLRNEPSVADNEKYEKSINEKQALCREIGGRLLIDKYQGTNEDIEKILYSKEHGRLKYEPAVTAVNEHFKNVCNDVNDSFKQVVELQTQGEEVGSKARIKVFTEVRNNWNNRGNKIKGSHSKKDDLKRRVDQMRVLRDANLTPLAEELEISWGKKALIAVGYAFPIIGWIAAAYAYSSTKDKGTPFLSFFASAPETQRVSHKAGEALKEFGIKPKR